jgi:hypothetical protein
VLISPPAEVSLRCCKYSLSGGVDATRLTAWFLKRLPQESMGNMALFPKDAESIPKQEQRERLVRERFPLFSFFTLLRGDNGDHSRTGANRTLAGKKVNSTGIPIRVFGKVWQCLPRLKP